MIDYSQESFRNADIRYLWITSIWRSVQPSRPSVSTCCFFSWLKTFTSARDHGPDASVNVLELLLRLAGVQVCGIRTIPIAETGGWRSPKPEHGDHRNRAWRSPKPGIPITETGDGDRLSAAVRPVPDLR